MLGGRIAVGGLVVLAFGLACAGGTKSDTWDGEVTFVCGGSQKKTVTGETVVMKGEDLLAIDAGGGCELELVNCDITADFPLKAAGNAKVTIKGGRIHGNKQAIQAWGNAVVTVDGAKIEGEVVTTGNGKIAGM